MVIIMKKNNFDEKIKTALQNQSVQYEVPSKLDERIITDVMQIHEKETEEDKMKHFNMKKVIIAIMAAVMVLGTIAVASGKVVSIVSHSLSYPTYTNYSDLSKAEAEANVTTNAPEKFENGYEFYGIYILENQYLNDVDDEIDNFTSLEIEYRLGDDKICLEVQPRPIETSYDYYDEVEDSSVTYSYHELLNKWVPVSYEPTEEEKKQMEEGTLNIGVGADEISYSTSKSVLWNIDGQGYTLFCMDNDISEDELIKMAFEINQ
jgi:hypothetical protein